MGTQGAAREYQTELRLVDAARPELIPIDVSRGAPASLHGALDRTYQRFLEVFVFSSVWIAAGLASLTIFSAHVLGIDLLELNLLPTAVVLFSGMLIYNLDHAVDTKVEGIPDAFAAQYFRRKGVMIPLLLGSTVAMVASMWTAPQEAIWAFGCYVGIGLLYGLPLVPWGPRKLRLKDIPGVKAWLTAFAMMTGGLALPLAWWVGTGRANPAGSETIVLLGAFLFVFCSSNTHAFDVRDMENDRKVGVRSLPVQAGLARTKAALVLLNLVMLAILGYEGHQLFSVAGHLVMGDGAEQSLILQHPEILGCTAMTVLYLLAIREDTPRDVYSILIDGCFFLPALLGLGHEALTQLSWGA